MSTTEDRARAAMRAIAATAGDAPPLEFSPARAGHGRDRRRRSWLAPVTAAVTVAALAVTLVLVKNLGNGGAAPASPSPAAASGNPSGDGSVPEYYVAWLQADALYLVGDAVTGQAVATVRAPAGVTPRAVYGTAGDDRTFIVAGERGSGARTGTAWYLLRIAPGTKGAARLTPLPVPVSQWPAGVALSPDGTEVAVALPGSPATLRVYSVASGALLHQWSTAAPGVFTAQKGSAASWPSTASVLRWSPDGRQLAFAWNGSAIRVLSASGPDGNLTASSKPLAAIGTTYATLGNFTCDAVQGWQFIKVAQGPAAGQGIVCGGSAQAGVSAACTSPADTTCTYTQRNSIGFLRATKDSRGGSFQGLDSGVTGCPSLGQPGNGAYLYWANADGSEVIGSLVCAGRSRFGIFRGSEFTPLPGLPASLPAPAPDGTVAW